MKATGHRAVLRAGPLTASDRQEWISRWSAATSEPPAELPLSFVLDGRVAVVIGGTGVLGSRMAKRSLKQALGRHCGRDRVRADAALERLRTAGREVTSRRATQPCEPRSATCSSVCSPPTAESMSSSTQRHDFDNAIPGHLRRGNGASRRRQPVRCHRSCQEFGRYFVARAQSSGEGRASSTLAALRDLRPFLGCSRTR